MQADSIIPLASQGSQAWDRFAYVNNSPTNFTDPTGHTCEDSYDPGCVDWNQGNPYIPPEQLIVTPYRDYQATILANTTPDYRAWAPRQRSTGALRDLFSIAFPSCNARCLSTLQWTPKKIPTVVSLWGEDEWGKIGDHYTYLIDATDVIKGSPNPIPSPFTLFVDGYITTEKYRGRFSQAQMLAVMTVVEVESGIQSGLSLSVGYSIGISSSTFLSPWVGIPAGVGGYYTTSKVISNGWEIFNERMVFPLIRENVR